MTNKNDILNNEQSVLGESNSRFRQYLKSFGPGIIVAAGVVGPGTITTFSLLGAEYRYLGLWVILAACIIGYIFQEPAIRITLHAKITVLEAIREHIGPSSAIITFICVFFGAIAFQAGNFIGAGLALDFFIPGIRPEIWAALMAIIVLVIAWAGVYRLLENLMTAVVALIVLSFVITVFLSGPDIMEIFKGGAQLTVPGNDYWLLAAVISTTVVPTGVLALSTYIKQKHAARPGQLGQVRIKHARFDLRLNTIVLLAIGVSIVIAAGTVINPTGIEIKGAQDMAQQLTPLLGRFAGVLFSLGLWAAAISSGLYHATLQPRLMNEAFGLPVSNSSVWTRTIIVGVTLIPVAFLFAFGGAPIALIVTAQALNALIIPIVVIMVFILLNKKSFLGDRVNTRWQNTRYLLVVVIAVFLAIRVFLRLIGFDGVS